MNRSFRILAVEDDPEIRDILARVFEGEGIDAKVVGTLQAFRDTLAQWECDICIVDIGLPDGDGLTLVSELRVQGRHGVIILTGRGSEVDQVVGLELGADDYILKPFRPRELLARVRAVARRLPATGPQQPPDDTITLAGYRVNLPARIVTDSAGAEISLTTAEFDVLAALLEHRGEAMSRAQITRAMHGVAWHVSDRAIDGLVSRLRRKLPVAPPAKHVIRTLHGVGYTITPE